MALFAKELTRLLDGSRITRRQVAERIGIHTQMLWLLQSGKRLPTPEMVDQVGLVLDLTLAAKTRLHRCAARDRGYRI